MGGKESKPSIISYEDAVNRVTKAELSRLQNAYKSACGFSNIMKLNILSRDVLGDYVPSKLAQRIFEVMSSSSRGMNQRDLITTLVLLTRGKQEERIKLIFAIYADQNCLYVTRRSMALMVTACEGTALPLAAADLFRLADRIYPESFCGWVRKHPDITSVSKWLLNHGGVTVSLTDSTEMPNFYQTLAGVTHLEEADIIELEKHYWGLRSQSKTGRVDLQLFKTTVCPPLPECLVEGLFGAFDQNSDNHIDFKEISCGVSACCRGPLAERQKFCFKVFDKDQDGKLNSQELRDMAISLLKVKKMSRKETKNRNNTLAKGNAQMTLNLQKENPENNQLVRNALSPISANPPPVLKVAGSKFFDVSPRAKRKNENMNAKASLPIQPAVHKEPLNVNGDVTNTCEEPTEEEIESVLSSALQYSVDKEGYLTLEEYQMWGMDDVYPNMFLNIVIELCHIVLGLRPCTPEEEGAIIRGWMQRCDYHDVSPGETWFIVASEWWSKWKKYTSYDPVLTPSRSRKWEHEAMENDVDIAQNHSHSSSSDTISSAVEASEALSHANLSQHHHKSHKLRLPTKKKSKSKENVTTISAGINSLKSKAKVSPGPIVNSSVLLEEHYKVATLTDEGGTLKDTVVCGEDFVLLPEPVWKAIHHWYGGSQVLPRIVPAAAEDRRTEIELYRLHVLLLKHQVHTSSQQNMHVFTGSGTIAEVGNATFGMLRSSLNYVTGTNSTPKRYLAHRATFSKAHTIKQVETFLAYRLHMHYDNIRLWNYIEESNAFIMEDESATLEDFGIKNNSQILIEVRNMDMSWPEEICQLAKNKRSKPKKAVEKGVTGLSNIGNTCFMNAGLQCISNTSPLTEYFTSHKHLFELNRTNPLGMKGHIAKRYGDLVQDLWSGNNKSIAPLKLRWTISKYAPRFNGNSQHDAQELLSFLLDGLHEDLNRVHDKPYVELKDSDGRPDEEVAQEAWENHLMRNQSIIVDLFHGQIRSQVRCLECNAVSVRFDPFTFLALPLPMDNSMYMDVTLVRLKPTTPMKYGITLSMEEKYVEVRSKLSELCGIGSDNLLLVEIGGATVRSFVSDTQKVRSAISGSLYAFEIPSPQTLDLEMKEPCSEVPVKTTEHKEPYVANSHETRKTCVRNMNAIYQDTTTKNESKTDHGTDESARSDVSTEQSVNGIHNSPVNGTIVNGDIKRSFSTTSSSSTLASSTSQGTITQIKSQCYVIAYHRKTFLQELYFLSSQKMQKSLFGVPVVVPFIPGNKRSDLYKNVWDQVSRLASPLPPSEAANHAQDCDNSLSSKYPFVLRSVKRCGTLCGEGCSWFKFCQGCVIECNSDRYFCESEYIAIDWDPTALHLRYQPSIEREVVNHHSVDEETKGQKKPIDLHECLKAFTTEEELGKDELYYCGKCKKHQLAKKKLDIWRLPPILIIHLKRFQFVNGHWIKSHKIVNVQKNDFDPSSFMTKRENRHGHEIDSHHVLNDSVTSQPDTEDDCSDAQTSMAKKSDKHIKFADDDLHEKGESPAHESGDKSAQSSETTKRKRRPSAGPARERKPSFREEEKPLFNLFAVACHSGIICGGHYVAYAKNPNGNWYCYNDSSCKQVKEDEMDIDTSYILFYERQGLKSEDFIPTTEDKQLIDTANMDDDFNSEYKKLQSTCSRSDIKGPEVKI